MQSSGHAPVIDPTNSVLICTVFGNLMFAVDALRVKHEVHERQGEQRLHLREVTNRGETEPKRGWIAELVHSVSRGEANTKEGLKFRSRVFGGRP